MGPNETFIKELGTLAGNEETSHAAPVGQPRSSDPFAAVSIEALQRRVLSQRQTRAGSLPLPRINVSYVEPQSTALEEFDLAREVKRSRSPTPKPRRRLWAPALAVVVTLCALAAAWSHFVAPYQGRPLLPSRQELITKLKPILRNAP